MRLVEISMAANRSEKLAPRLGRMLGVEQSEVTEDRTALIQARSIVLNTGSVLFAVMSSTDPGSPIDRFLASRGEGLFSISFEVDDITAAMTHFRECGAEFVLPEPLILLDWTNGFARYRECAVNFTRPRSTGGVCIELQELRPYPQ